MENEIRGIIIYLCAILQAVVIRAASDSDLVRLRVMTFNVPYGNIEVTDGNGMNTLDNRLGAIQRYMAQIEPDLLGMQEMNREMLMKLLVGMPEYAMIGTGVTDGADGGAYVPIIYRTTRFYCLESGTYWVSDTPDQHSHVDGTRYYRNATWGLFQDKETGARFLYTNTHLSFENPDCNLLQIKILKPHMQALGQRYGTELPQLLTGDFNMPETWENNYNYVLNYKLPMFDAWATARSRNHYQYGKTGPKTHVDYVFTTRNVSSAYAQFDNRKDADDYWMSDHDPHWADLTFRPSNADLARFAVSQAYQLLDSLTTYTRSLKLITSSTQLETDGSDPATPLANILDGKTATSLRSLATPVPPRPHYLQIRMIRRVSDFQFNYTRSEGGPVDRWQDVLVTASDDGEHWDYITELHNFGDDRLRVITSPNIALHHPYAYVRFNIMRTPSETLRNGHPQHSLSEFQMYENKISPQSLRYVSPSVSQAADRVESLAAELFAFVSSDVDQTDESVPSLTASLNEATEQLRQSLASSVPTVSSVSDETIFHDLMGRRVSTPQPGAIYITAPCSSANPHPSQWRKTLWKPSNKTHVPNKMK